MSEHVHEQLSALTDGELPREELRFLLKRMEGDTELVERWSRYQFASGVLKRQLNLPLRADFAALVMERLEGETMPARRRGGLLLRWAGGGAIAAAVAVVALVATRPAAENPSAPGLVATAPAAAKPAEPRSTPAPLPPSLVNYEFAQPASYDYNIYNFARQAGEQAPNGSYVLLIPRQPSSGDSSRAEQPRQ
ncbi:MAG TPA: sigma-E factor negative regulatory protein [Rudaea sp.]|nr:sigma-E factor negative regulatory protein [Rudaea sp.]